LISPKSKQCLFYTDKLKKENDKKAHLSGLLIVYIERIGGNTEDRRRYRCLYFHNYIYR